MDVEFDAEGGGGMDMEQQMEVATGGGLALVGVMIKILIGYLQTILVSIGLYCEQCLTEGCCLNSA